MTEASNDQAAVVADRYNLHVPLWILALLIFSATLAMHIFVPALPAAGRDLGASVGQMQMTISVYILGLAFGQLIYGPLSDRFGRRSMLGIGLGLYTLASLAAALAPNVQTLIPLRLFQAFGGCAGMVLGRAIVRDTAPPTEAARRMALTNMMVTLGPGIAPLIGEMLASTLGWRFIFVALAGLGITNIMLTWRLLPETGAPGSGVSVRVLAGHYGQLLRSPAFLGYAIGGGCATTAGYAFISAAPFILVQQLHRTSAEVGPYLAILVLGIWAGSILASRLISRIPIRRLLLGGSMLSATAALLLLAVVATGHLHVAILVGTMFVFMLGVGMVAPASLTLAISINPHVIGSASGLYGFTQMVVGALCTALAGLGTNPALAAALVLAVAGVIAQVCFRIASDHTPRH